MECADTLSMRARIELRQTEVGPQRAARGKTVGVFGLKYRDLKWLNLSIVM